MPLDLLESYHHHLNIQRRRRARRWNRDDIALAQAQDAQTALESSTSMSTPRSQGNGSRGLTLIGGGTVSASGGDRGLRMVRVEYLQLFCNGRY